MRTQISQTKPTRAFKRSVLMLSAAISAISLGNTARAQDAPLTSDALPTGFTVVAGSGTATVSVPGSMTVDQATDRAVFDWTSFDIGSGASVTFNQLSSTSIAVNRVVGAAAPSQIAGNLSANGRIAILNANGVMFAGSANVDVGGLIASTGSIDVDAFSVGGSDLQVVGASEGEIVVSAGANITTYGLAALVAPRVRNSGTITATAGKVQLGAGTAFTLDLAGDGLLSIDVGASNALVEIFGELFATGGRVQLTARQASALVSQSISSTVLPAVHASLDGNAIVLTGSGDVALTADLDATGDVQLSGGRIYGTGQINVADGSLALSVNYGGLTSDTTSGTWIRDALGVIGAVDDATTITLGAGSYAGNFDINKSNVTLLSALGRDVTTIVGSASGSGLGAVQVSAGNVTVGGVGQGFTILGYDGVSPAVETAAVYLRGSVSNVSIIGNRITAGGDLGLLSEYGATVSNISIQGNIFDGKTYVGAAPATGDQFTVANVSRQLVAMGGGAGGGNTSNILFSGNSVIGDSGLNSAVTIDAQGAVISGNSFASTTGGWGSMLRARGTNTLITGNIFNTGNLAESATVTYLRGSILGGAGNTDLSALYGANTVTGNFVYAIPTGAVSATAYYGSGRSIAVGLGYATAGSSVHVSAGTYAETVAINRSISLVGAGANLTNITGGISLSNVNDVTLQGFTVSGDGGSNTVIRGSGTVGNLSISAVQVNGNDVTGRSGLAGATFGGTVTISGSGFSNLDGTALLMTPAAELNVSGNSFTNNGTALGFASGVALPTLTVLENNSFANNGYALFLPATATGDAVVRFDAGNNIVAGARTIQHIEWRSRSGLNLTGVRFGGMLGSEMTIAQRLATEDLITHGIDAGGVGLARLVSGQLYATAGSGSGALARAVALASEGDVINLGAGTFATTASLNLYTTVSLAGQGVGVTTIDASAHATYGIRVTADNVSLSGFTLLGNSAVSTSNYGVKVEAVGGEDGRNRNFAIRNVAISGSYRTGLDLNHVLGGVIENVTVTGVLSGNGISITDTANLTVTNASTSNNAWGGMALYQANRNRNQQLNNITITGSTFAELNGLFLQNSSAVHSEVGSLNLQGFTHTVRNADHRSTEGSWVFFRTSEQDAVNFAVNFAPEVVSKSVVQAWAGTANNNNYVVGVGQLLAGGTQAMSLQTALNISSNGDHIKVLSGSYGESIALTGNRALAFGDVTLTSINLTGAGTTIAGNLSTTGDLSAANALTLTGAASLTSGQTLTLGSVSGGFGLSLSGADVSVGSIQITGPLQVAGTSTVLMGDSYSASAIGFTGGSVRATQGETLFTTATGGNGSITFASTLVGTAAGAQNLRFVTGSGEGVADGDINLGDVGSNTLRLGALSVTGGNFSAQTVKLGGDFTSLLSGDQLFSANTLDTLGNVLASIQGRESGPVVAGGSVGITAGTAGTGNIVAGGPVQLSYDSSINRDISSGAGVTLNAAGPIQSNINAGGAVSLAASSGAVNANVQSSGGITVVSDGGVSGSFNTPGAVQFNAGSTVNVTVDAGSVGVSAPSGSVNGNFGSITTAPGGTLIVNEAPVVGSGSADIRQLLIDSFLAPAGGSVAADGTISLPAGLGVVANNGGQTVAVGSVSQLGELLRQGFSAVIVDVDGGSDGDGKEEAAAN